MTSPLEFFHQQQRSFGLEVEPIERIEYHEHAHGAHPNACGRLRYCAAGAACAESRLSSREGCGTLRAHVCCADKTVG
jgi:hypothetical protein